MANKSDNIIEEEARAIEVGEETGGMPQQRRQRDSWASRTGFILACVGSAVGMANIWLFPYRVAQLGGAAFLIPYLIFVALLGFTGVIGEMSFGRAMGTGPMGAFGKAMEMRGIRFRRLARLRWPSAMRWCLDGRVTTCSPHLPASSWRSPTWVRSLAASPRTLATWAFMSPVSSSPSSS